MRESSEKGLISHLAAFAAGAASGSNHHHGYPSHHGCPPQGYSHHVYPPQGYPTAGCPPQGYPTSGYPSTSYPPTYAYPPPSYAYPPPSYYGSHHGHGGMSGSLVGGAAVAATAYGVHRLRHGHHGTSSGYGHGHGKFKHGKFKKYGFYGKQKHFGRWK